MYPDQRRPASTNSSVPIKEEPTGIPQQLPQQQTTHKDREKEKDRSDYSQSKSSKNQTQSSSQQMHKSSVKDIKTEDKETLRVKQEGQKPTMETQGPPPPPTSQYFIHPSYMSPGPFGFDPASHIYRNMMVPTAYGTSPYHLQMSRIHAPEDLSRNPNPKALDILQHHANQYYNPHKIHELSERALKSPTGNVKVVVSSPNVTQHQPPPPQHSSSPSPNVSSSHGPLGSSNTGNINLTHQSPVTLPSASGAPSKSNATSSHAEKMNIINDMPAGIIKEGPNTGRSPPPQRHVHTHHHTHVGVGLGYPMYPAAYGGNL